MFEEFEDKAKEFLSPASNTINKSLYDWYNLAYIGAIYMGANREPINVIWDTGSFIYIGETHLCTTCTTPKYDF